MTTGFIQTLLINESGKYVLVNRNNGKLTVKVKKYPQKVIFKKKENVLL